jgi:hypothetical protein
MKMTRQLVTACAVVFGIGCTAALAGPCNTGKSAEMRDAGSGPTPGATGATVGTSPGSGQHPPTGAMNQQTGSSPASSQDAQRQMQGQPTAAQQAGGANPTAGDNC